MLGWVLVVVGGALCSKVRYRLGCVRVYVQHSLMMLWWSCGWAAGQTWWCCVAIVTWVSMETAL